MKSSLLIVVPIWGFILGMAALAVGQNPQNAQINAPARELQPAPGLRGTQPVAEENSEFGALIPMERTKAWFVMPYVSDQGYWTSNAILTNGEEVGDAVWSEMGGVTAGYRVCAELELQADYNYQIIRYQENPFLDTNQHNASFTATYKLPWDFELSGGIRGTWMRAPHQDTEIYRENNPFIGIMQTHSYLEDRLKWFYGYEFDPQYAHPVTYDRQEHNVYTGVSYNWLTNLTSQLILLQNWQFYGAPQFVGAANGRQEWVSNVMLQTVWQPLHWLQVTAFGVATYDNSINASFDYKNANLGGEIKAFWKF